MSATTTAAALASPYGQQVERDMLATLQPLGMRGRLWIGTLLAFIAFGAFAYTLQLMHGLQVTAMRNYVSWGLYMTNFVFFIGISHAGTLISAILRVTNADWRRPITRMAEAITVFALLVGAPMVIIDMGRPDRVLNVFMHGRMQSPILWDVCSITTYLLGSLLYLYVAMIPDMPILARRAKAGRQPRWRVRLYQTLALGYRGSAEQERRLNRALGAMAVIIIPVAISVHTVVSWVFGMTVRPGWHSTIFGPYFVVGAIFSGTAAIITAMAVFRWAYGLGKYLTLDHFRKLALLLLALTLLYVYFTLSEYLTVWYGGMATEARLLELLMGRTVYGSLFWLWVAFGLFLPVGLLLFPGRRSLASIVTASVLINVGMWLKRYLIVVPTLETPYIPAAAGDTTIFYFPTWIEWAVTLGGLATFLLLYTLFSRLFPIISIWETAEDGMSAEDGGESGPARAPKRPMPMAARLLCLVAGGAALASIPASARAQESLEATSVDVVKDIEDDVPMLIATVTSGGEPVSGARVEFHVSRLFGALLLGEDVTLGDGTAAVELPTELPGNAAGELHVRARIVAPDERAGAEWRGVVTGAPPPAADGSGGERTLWSVRPPLPLVAVFGGLLAVVWSTYALVLYQLFRIRSPGVRRHARGPA